MSRPRAADDFATIRGRIKELRREHEPIGEAESAPEIEARRPGRGRLDERYRDRIEGAPPPWVPTIFYEDGAVRFRL